MSAAELRRGCRCRSAAIELSDDPRFAGRVRRLAFVSIAALGWLVVLWSRTAETLPLAGAALVAGWITMPLTLLASLQQPLIRYALVVPSTLVTGGVVAMLVRAPLGGVTAAGWTVILAGLALGAVLGGWFWMRVLPVPRALDNPFSTARQWLIRLHVLLVVAGMALTSAAAI